MSSKLKKKNSSWKENVDKRINVIAVLFLAAGAVIISRLFFIQVINSGDYKVLAKNQLENLSFAVSEEEPRGRIFFQEKNGSLITAAAQKHGFFLAINPASLDKPEEVFLVLSQNLSVDGQIAGIDKDDFLKRAGKKDDPFEVVSHRLNESQAQKIKELGLKGVNVFPEDWRFYPAGNLASHILGFVGFKGDKLTGRYGLENYYEDALSGQPMKLTGNVFLENIVNILSKKIAGSESSGRDIVLTIEPSVQSFLEDKLEKLQEKWSTKSAGGIIIEPKTGKILALAKKPDFNPNSYGEISDFSIFVNPLVENIFEMGSVFKPLTVAAGLDAGKISEETEYVDQGYLIFNERRIENYDGKGRGKVDMQEVLNQSLNTGAVFAMQQLGKNVFLDYLKAYGLDARTGVDLPNEVKGNIKNLDSSREIEYATASFGQGIAVSPLELSVALASLANGGYIKKPFLVEKIIEKGGKDKIIEPETLRSVISQSSSERITRMLVKTVDEALLEGTLKLKNYTVAAKTGTAQIPNQEEGGYYEDRFFHAFFGYAPAFDSRFLVLLYLEAPQGVRYASYSLGPDFMDTIKFLLNYYEVPPDR